MPRAVLLMLPLAGAEGALAVAVPPDVAKQGFTYDYDVNSDTTEKAQATALADCRAHALAETKDPNSKLRASLCKVISTFHDQCVAVAMDPLDGTPGVGWAVAADLRSAEKQALDACEATAGPGRRAACQIDHSKCDGAAK
jgi:uncharacterized protein DUF4189